MRVIAGSVTLPESQEGSDLINIDDIILIELSLGVENPHSNINLKSTVLRPPCCAGPFEET